MISTVCLSIFLLGLSGISGCLPKPVSREQLSKEVLQQDPSFAPTIEKYRSLVSRIDTYERELAVKRSAVEQNIDRLRGELQKSTQTVKRRIDETKKLMAPERQELITSLSLAEEQLRATRAQRMSVGRRMVQLRKALKGPTRSADEKARYQTQFNDALTEAQRLDQEAIVIKDHIRLLKIKVRLVEF